jgi:hypothetical protein
MADEARRLITERVVDSEDDLLLHLAVLAGVAVYVAGEALRRRKSRATEAPLTPVP